MRQREFKVREQRLASREVYQYQQDLFISCALASVLFSLLLP
jgi:hypothetical protein